MMHALVTIVLNAAPFAVAVTTLETATLSVHCVWLSVHHKGSTMYQANPFQQPQQQQQQPNQQGYATNSMYQQQQTGGMAGQLQPYQT